MATDKDIIVAIELGSSAIRGIAGRKNMDGTLQILDVVERKNQNGIRKGVVYNIDKTVQTLNSIFNQLREDLQVYINKAYVGIGGVSLGTVRNSTSKKMPSEVIITSDLVDSLIDSNYNVNYPDKIILDVRPQEYRIGTHYVTEPVGVIGQQVEGHFLNVVIRSSVKENIQKCFDAVGVQILDMHIAPLALANNLLTDNEMRSGCALVDIGAETTTVSIYKNNILRHLSVIPLGSNNITLDICSKQVEEEEAEDLKLKYGTAFSDINKESSRFIPLSFDPSIKIAESELQEITEARMSEIISNVSEQIKQSEYSEKLTCGIILTGGGSNIPNIEKAVNYKIKTDKVKIAKTLQTIIIPGNFVDAIQEMNANTLISLLECSDLDCTDVDPRVEAEKKRLLEEEMRKQQEAEAYKKQLELQQKQEAEKQAEQEKTKQNQEPEKKKEGITQSVKSFFIRATKLFTETEE